MSVPDCPKCGEDCETFTTFDEMGDEIVVVVDGLEMELRKCVCCGRHFPFKDGEALENYFA